MTTPVMDLEHRVSLLEAQVKLLTAAAMSKPVNSLPDADIDDPKWGDPEVRLHLKKWGSKVVKGKRMSQCSPEELRQLASALLFFADEDDKKGAVTKAGKPQGPYRRQDAAKASAWAKRIEANGPRMVVENEAVYGYQDTDDDLPEAFR